MILFSIYVFFLLVCLYAYTIAYNAVKSQKVIDTIISIEARGYPYVYKNKRFSDFGN